MISRPRAPYRSSSPVATGRRIAVLFPGQGSQTGDMRDVVERFCPVLLELARQIVGADPFERVDEGTQYLQPAIFCASLAGWERLAAGSLRAAQPDFLAGHSLGELAALTAAQSVDVEDALHVVAVRGKVMHNAGETGDRSGMLAVRAARDQAEAVAERHGVAVANDNAPDQVVLSGALVNLDAAAKDLEARGVRSKRLPVSAAFHSQLMASAEPELREMLARVEFRAPRIPVFSGVTAAPFDDIPERLAQALTRPVRWLEILRTLHAAGSRRFVETGPGTVLTGLVRRSLDGVEAVPPEPLQVSNA